ncbi:MAG TPA: rhodanese-like domain-containing protein [Vicinamibacterales bacterium]|jgi:rhodanese-related sulfurtransferase
MSAGRITAEALLTRIESGAAPLILDVRSRLEFARGHVPGARHIPFWRVSPQIDESSIPRDAELVVYCGHGPRAVIAGRALRRRGFTRITYLDGHFSKWRSAGFREET